MALVFTSEQQAAFDAAVAIWKTTDPVGDFSALKLWPMSRWYEVAGTSDEFLTQANLSLGGDDTLVLDITTEVEDQMAANATCSEAELVAKVEAVNDWDTKFKKRVLAHAKALGWNPATARTTNPAPTIVSITPNTGVENVVTEAVVTGTNFVNGSKVLVGAAVMPTTFVSDTQLKAKMVVHAPGVVDVKVTNPDGQTAVKASGFTYTKKPATGGGGGGTPPGGTPPIIVTTTGTDPAVLGAMIENGRMVSQAVNDVLDRLNPHIASSAPPAPPMINVLPAAPTVTVAPLPNPVNVQLQTGGLKFLLWGGAAIIAFFLLVMLLIGGAVAINGGLF